MRAMLDIDGCLAEFVKSFTQWCCEVGVATEQLTAADQKDWQLGYPFKSDEVWDKLKATRNWWMRVEPIVTPQEIKLLNNISQFHDLYFITNRPGTVGLNAEQQSEQWLRSLGMDTSRVSVLATKGSKGELCQSLNITVALEDRLENLVDLKAHGVTAVARGWQYNASWEPRVNSVGEFLDKYIQYS